MNDAHPEPRQSQAVDPAERIDSIAPAIYDSQPQQSMQGGDINHGSIARATRTLVSQGYLPELLNTDSQALAVPKDFKLLNAQDANQLLDPSGELPQDEMSKREILVDQRNPEVRISKTEWGHFIHDQAELDAYQKFLNGIAPQDLGKPLGYSSKQLADERDPVMKSQMEQVNEYLLQRIFSMVPKGLDPRQHENCQFSVQEMNINNKPQRVLVEESEVKSWDQDQKNASRQVNVYANPDAENHTLSVTSMEAPAGAFFTALTRNPDAQKLLNPDSWSASKEKSPAGSSTGESGQQSEEANHHREDQRPWQHREHREPGRIIRSIGNLFKHILG